MDILSNQPEHLNLEPQDIEIRRNVPINKGNYSSFETQEREKLFEDSPQKEEDSTGKHKNPRKKKSKKRTKRRALSD